MRIPILAAMILASSVATLAWAQQPMRMPSAPEAGSPGTATLGDFDSHLLRESP